MIYQSKRIAVVDTPTPEAALYFENVYCLNGSSKSVYPIADHLLLPETAKYIPNFILDTKNTIGLDHWAFKKTVTEKASEIIKKNFLHQKNLDIHISEILSILQEYSKQGPNQDKAVEVFNNLYGTRVSSDFNIDHFLKNLLIASVTSYHRDLGFYVVPVFEYSSSPNWMNGNNLNDGIEISLLGLPLIEGKNIEWKHAKEVREDSESIKHLRNLRLFLEGIDKENGKDYIQDIILKKIEDYEIAAKKHGFSLKSEPIKALLELQHIPKIISYGILSLIDPSINNLDALLGLLTTTEISGAINEIGNLSLTLKSQKVMKGLESEHQDIEYLIQIKKSISE